MLSLKTLALLIFHKISYSIGFVWTLSTYLHFLVIHNNQGKNLAEEKYPVSSFVMNGRGEKAISNLAPSLAH